MKLVEAEPPAVATTTLTAPPACAGVVKVSVVAVLPVGVTDAPSTVSVAPVRLVPVSVTAVPPAAGPLAGEGAPIVGAAT